MPDEVLDPRAEERRVRARAAAVRIMAHASLAIMEERGWQLATVRRLPDYLVLRSIPFGTPQGLSETLDEVWDALGDGDYLVTTGDAERQHHSVVSITGQEREAVVTTLAELERALSRERQAHTSSKPAPHHRGR